MMNSDKLIQETYERKNELESLIYAIKRNCAEKYSEFSTPDVCNALIAKSDEFENWLYEEGAMA